MQVKNSIDYLVIGERNAQFTVYKLSMGKSVYVPTELHKFLERNPDRTLAVSNKKLLPNLNA